MGAMKDLVVFVPNQEEVRVSQVLLATRE
jgi:hypothetical protein